MLEELVKADLNLLNYKIIQLEKEQKADSMGTDLLNGGII